MPEVVELSSHPVWGDDDRERWSRWWEALVEGFSDGSGDSLTPAFQRLFEREAGPFGVDYSEAARWVSERTSGIMSPAGHLSRDARLAVNRAVVLHEQRVKRAARDFSLDIVVLPVASAWSARRAPNVVFVDGETRRDADRFTEIVRAVLETIG